MSKVEELKEIILRWERHQNFLKIIRQSNIDKEVIDDWENKINIICKEIYRAKEVTFSPLAEKKVLEIENLGYSGFPICMAKTQYSFSTNPKNVCAPINHTVPIRELRLSAGAEFIVAIAGDIMTMPGLPKKPAAYEVGVNNEDQIIGLF